MHTFRLALAQINSTVGDLNGNSEKILGLIKEARSLNTDLIAFPEMAITGYPSEDLLHKPSFIRDNIKALQRIANATEGFTVAVGFVDATEHIYNSAAVIRDKKIFGIYHKMLLPTYGVFDEDRYFKKGASPINFNIAGTIVGISICEDIWYPEGPLEAQRSSGAEVIVNINASPYHAGKQRDREKMLAARSAENQLFVAYVNAVGGQDELVFDGTSLIFGPDGTLLAKGLQFEEDLLVIDLNVEGMRNTRLKSITKNHPILPSPTERVDCETISVTECPNTTKSILKRRPHAPNLDPMEEIYRALVIGTKDYVKKSGFDGVIIGLSGGIDSSLTSCIAVDALGKNNVLGVSMPSRYSSAGSMEDAKTIAENLGITLWSIPIERGHAAYLDMLGDHLEGIENSITEENIQPRIRGSILMAISNQLGWMVLATGNKSEMAMGYATLYGDMAGGFAVLKDVPKGLVYELSIWRNKNLDPIDTIPKAILEKPPSAELKPSQTDQDILPPYSILDPILESYVEKDKSIQEIVDMGFARDTVKMVIATVDRNEYKRRQSPPGVKITPRAFGKDRRLPIVNHYRQS